MDHDGKGCPLPIGTEFFGAYEADPGRFRFVYCKVRAEMPSWDWSNWAKVWHCGGKVMALRRYKVRRPKALCDLISLAAAPYDPPPAIHPEGPRRLPIRLTR